MSYCPDHDPILAVPPFGCPGCGVTAYPAEAEWITAGLVLVTYEDQQHRRACGWPQQWTALVTPGDGSDMPRPPEDGALKARRHYRDQLRCTALGRTTGRRCRNPARDPGGACWVHTGTGEPGQEVA
jgi:hypothetical protein